MELGGQWLRAMEISVAVVAVAVVVFARRSETYCTVVGEEVLHLDRLGSSAFGAFKTLHGLQASPIDGQSQGNVFSWLDFGF